MSNARISGAFVLAVLSAPMLMGGACEKKTSKPTDTGAIAALDHAGSGGGSATVDGPVDSTPLQGVDVTKLDADKQKLFYKLVGSLKSPCGKAHSLRTSFASDATCKRAPFAVRYVIALLEDEATEQIAREEYGKKYDKPPAAAPPKFDTSKAPHIGAEDAPVRLVEFFDYECPHCEHFKPVMEQVMADKQGQVAEYFMMFPIESKHPDAKSAAQAALAANAQGKFKEMHDKLFEKSPAHNHEAVTGYAKELGLDMAKFEKAYDDAAAQVASDEKQGDAAGVDSTPTLFFNDRKYEGPMATAKYIEMWIDEELAVNR